MVPTHWKKSWKREIVKDNEKKWDKWKEKNKLKRFKDYSSLGGTRYRLIKGTDDMHPPKCIQIKFYDAN